MKSKEDSFTQGYICACSVCYQQHQDDTIVEDMLRGNYTSVKELRKKGVDEHDIQTLMPVIKEIERKRKLKY